MKEKIYNLIMDSYPEGTYTRVGNNNPHNIYVGRNEKDEKTVFFRMENKPKNMKSLKFIDVLSIKSKVNMWELFFVLKEDAFNDMFTHLCYDLVVNSFYVSKEDLPRFLYIRYNSWKKLFENKEKTISERDEKGLIGELVYLKNYIIPKYGVDNGIKSWNGSENWIKDFSIGDYWYEVKTTTLNNSVKISSIEQLDSEYEGILSVVNIEKTSNLNYKSITLDSLVNNVRDVIKNDETRFYFENSLIQRKYIEGKSNTGYFIKKVDEYIVNSKFPCLRRKDLPKEINRVKYELSLENLDVFKK